MARMGRLVPAVQVMALMAASAWGVWGRGGVSTFRFPCPPGFAGFFWAPGRTPFSRGRELTLPGLKALAAVWVSLWVSAQAPAQPLFGGAESIECTVANSEVVVVGKLVEFDGKEQADERGGRTATIAVEETLKGEHRDRLRVRLPQP